MRLKSSNFNPPLKMFQPLLFFFFFFFSIVVNGLQDDLPLLQVKQN